MKAWVTVAITDRAAAARTMLLEVSEQCDDVGLCLVVLLVENSVGAAQRAANRDTAAMLRMRGCEVSLLDESPYRRPIAISRERQRAWIRARVRHRPAPVFTWMLDDDNRLDHLVWDGNQLTVRRLEHHVSRLLDLAVADERPDLLVGVVSGDPPIPPVATLASRLTDLACNLKRLLDAKPDDSAAEVLSDLPVSEDFDAYYDFSHERKKPTWATARRWLVRDADATAQQEVAALIAEAAHLGDGVALTRPILVRPDRLSGLAPGIRRGGNAVFFDMEACVQHAYPSVTLAGIVTRRSDMSGASRLARDFSVRTGGFSVRHCRPRSGARPSTEQLSRSILADTFGAALTRALSSNHPHRAVSSFLRDRAQAIQSALEAAVAAADGVEQQLARLPKSALRHEVATMLGWVRRAVPRSHAWMELKATLLEPSHQRILAAYPGHLARTQEGIG